jgi:hypothetical protein
MAPELGDGADDSANAERARPRAGRDVVAEIWAQRHRIVQIGSLTISVSALVVGAGPAVILLLVGLFFALRRLVSWVGLDLGPSLAELATPIRGWLVGQLDGLPLSADAFLAIWFAAGGGFLILSSTGSPGARIAWGIYCAATAASAYRGASAGRQWIVLVIASLLLAALSVVAFRRPRTRTETAAPPVREEVDESSPAPDDPAILADLLKLMLYRRAAYAQHVSSAGAARPTWIVDGGSGHGFTASPLADRTGIGQVVGIAYSPEMVADL